MIILKRRVDNLFFKYVNTGLMKNLFKKRFNERGFFFRLFRKFNLPFLTMYLGSWKKEIPNFDTVLFFDDGFNRRFSEYVKKKSPSTRVILWFWNTIDDSNEALLRDRNVDEFWTYSLADAKKHGIEYNTQFYSEKVELKKEKIVSDVVFLGRDKGRKDDLSSLEEELKSYNVKTDFRIIGSESDYCDYEKYLVMVAKSKCILDYNWSTAAGCTLRVMESIFLEKKLITNNKDIASCDFYRPENIFIIGKDDMSRIKEFVDSPYKKIDRKIVEYYDFENWLKRFERSEK